MITKGIRGATTVEENSYDAIKSATLELLEEIVKQNDFTQEDISHVIFTITKDLDKVNPATIARVDFGWDKTALMCFNEANIENSIDKCIRVLVVINCIIDFEPKFVYLKTAKNLRK